MVFVTLFGGLDLKLTCSNAILGFKARINILYTLVLLGLVPSGGEELACIKVDNIDRVNRSKF